MGDPQIMLMPTVNRDSYSINVFIKAHEMVPRGALWCKPGDRSLIPGAPNWKDRGDHTVVF